MAVAAEWCRCGSLTRDTLRAQSHERAGGRGGFHRRRALLWLPACGMQGEGIAAFAFPPAPPPETASVQSAEGLLPVQCPVIPGAGKPWDLHLVVQQLSPLKHPETKKERLFSAAEQTVRFLQQRGQRVPAPTLVGNRSRGLQP